MKLLLTSAYDTHVMLDALLERIECDRIGRHTLCDSPDEADAIVFVEGAHFDDYLYSKLSSHPYVADYPGKVFMYNESDKPWSVLPGLYCCMPKRFFQPHKQVAFAYIETPNQYIKDVHAWNMEKRWLFSFVGSSSHRCRHDVLALAGNNNGVRDTSEFNVWDSSDNEKSVQGNVYAETMAQSQFMLCPRGIGTSSSRLFESIEAGVAPVIISDQWEPTPHVDWDFAVRVDERNIARIPDLLRSIEDESSERGLAARAAWEASYAPDVIFDTFAESIGWLLEEQRAREQTSPHIFLRKLMIGGEAKAMNAIRVLRRQWQQVS